MPIRMDHFEVGFGTPDSLSFDYKVGQPRHAWIGVARGKPFHTRPRFSTLAHAEQAVESDLLYL